MSGPLDILFPHAMRTGDLVVRVTASFLADQSEPERDRWFWAYHIRIENLGDKSAQLISRRWLITDANGDRQRVEGEGVVGAQPVIAPGTSYDYVSGCALTTSRGTMEGSYRMVGDDGEGYEIRIPRFALNVPAVGA